MRSPAALARLRIDVARHLRESAWLDERGREAQEFMIADIVDFRGRAGTRSVALLRSAISPAGVYLVPLDERDQPIPEGSCSTLDELVVDAVRRRRPNTAEFGGRMDYRGDPPRFDGGYAFDYGWSSNALSTVRLGGALHVHKRYRSTSPAINEPELLHRFRDIDCLPEFVADYSYISPGGTRFPLGVIYRHVSGESLEGVLRRNLRALWNERQVSSDSATVADHVSNVGDVLSAAGRTIARLHRALAGCTEDHRPLLVGRYLQRTEGLLATTSAALERDLTHAEDARLLLRSQLTEVVSDLVAGWQEWPVSFAGLCHGDLHLAHFICQRHRVDEWAVRIIDLSPDVIDSTDPDFDTHTPCEDLIAVQRSLESFAAHEAAVESGRALGIDKRESCRAGVAERLGSAAGTEGESRRRARAVRDRCFEGSRLWAQTAFACFLKGYGEPAWDLTPEPVRRMLYLRRLLHELAYNYDHGRQYQVDIDLHHAAHLGLPAGVGTA